MLKVFIDSSGWYALVNNQHLNHDLAKEYFQKLLTSNAKIYTSIPEVNAAFEFSRIIDEANLSSKLHVSWFTRRLRRSSLKQFFSIKNQEIELSHCTIFEDVRKKKINVIFSFDDSLRKFGIPLMPQA